jgi:GDP-L-fucose synthase
MKHDSRIFVAGHRGLVGSALCRVLRSHGFENLVTASHKEVDLTDPVATKWFFSSYRPEYVILSAAKVGGIVGNLTYPVEFMTQNLRIEMNVLENAKEYGVKKLLFLGSACAYPKYAENPIRESALLTGALEHSNECYALAKISGIKLCEAYRSEYGCDFSSAMPTNLYGIGDNYHPEDSHVIPGMIRRIHEAKTSGKTAELWGTGHPCREFLFADDLAEACLALMQNPVDLGLVNIGYGTAIAIGTLGGLVAEAVEYFGEIRWDASKPDGTPERRMDSTKIFSTGWRPKVGLREGLAIAYKDFLCREHS